jgi:DNA-binding beta-propeller fold protein YncE
MKTMLRLFALVLLIVGVYGGTSLFREPAASSRLVSIQALPVESDTCQWETAVPDRAAARVPARPFFDVIGPAAVYAAADDPPPTSRLVAPPVRKIRDTYPIYSSVAIDLQHDEVVLQDNNLWSTKIFNRLDDTPPDVEFQKPKRVIEGDNTGIQYNNGLYIDQANGDIYSIESDTGDSVVVFSHSAQGDVPPARKLVTPHRGYALGMDEDRGELYASVEYPPKIAVYAKRAAGNAAPLRVIEGDATKLYAAHGLALDVQRKLLFVNNWGNESNFRVAGTGRFHPPSINVYSMDAAGNAAPLRVIQGDRTQLNWPGSMSVDVRTGELYVANDMGHSILVFKGTDQGDVAPSRVIKGAATGLRNPTGVFVDATHDELWVANFGSSTATVYPLKAKGDVAPLRTIRSRPRGTPSLNLGKTESVAYDSRREELLVPNCVNHPQIAAFARLGKENSPPVRAIAGQKTLISRTMHDLAYDAIHDEIVVPSPLTQAILTFRGGANGEEAPIRVIQGRKTRIMGVGAMDKAAIDPLHNEIFVATAAHNIVVFPREANGDVAPIRVLGGPDTRIRFAEQRDGGGNVPPIRIDPVRNLLVVPSDGGFLIFDRQASGNAKPLRAISGPKVGTLARGQMELYPPKGWIFAMQRGGVAVWHIEDSGDVAPRYRIPVQELLGLRMVQGIALDPAHKEVFIVDARNNLLTFSFPELF